MPGNTNHCARGDAPQAVVIGQGAAGLTVALTIARAGVPVVSLAKVRSGAATCTLYAGGGFTLGIGGLSPAEHRRMTLETGRGINVPGLLDAFAGEAPSIVAFLAEADVPFRTGKGGLGIARAEGFPLLGGKPLIDALLSACREAGVSFVTNAVAVRIIREDQGVAGVECLDHESGRVFDIAATAVVLATGGSGALFPRSDNPARITGDGYRLALDAGCHLLDMEFVQFYPIGIDIPGGAHWFMDLGVIDRARVTGPEGDEFLKEMLVREGIKSGREANLLARDKCTVAIARANERGEVLLHLEDIPETDWRSDPYLAAIARMFPPARPAWSGPVPLHPIEHYFPGGVAIGADGQTELPGLFACGEVTGGIDGANRVGGNALTNCVLFGRKAGAAAARHAIGEATPPLKLAPGARGQIPASSDLSLQPQLSAADWLRAWQRSAESADPLSLAPSELRRSLQAIAGECLLPVRSEDRLAAGLAQLSELGERLAHQAVRGRRDLLLAAENLGLWYTAAAVACAARLRTESRGAHYRSDFPREDATWERHIVLGREDRGALSAAVTARTTLE